LLLTLWIDSTDGLYASGEGVGSDDARSLDKRSVRCRFDLLWRGDGKI